MGFKSDFPMVHAAQSLALRRPVGARGEVTDAQTISAVWDKGRHALVEVTTRGGDERGELLVSTSQTMLLGGGGFGGDRGPATSAVEPDGEPTDVRQDTVRPEQAAIYRLLGDRNPLHIDPAAARRAGFDDVFLHGLATFGFATRAVLDAAGDGDPARLTSIACRFAKPVPLGVDLRTEIWRDGDDVRFRSLQGDVVALAGGTAALAS